MNLKVRVWVFFCKALILLGPIILVNDGFDLYGTLSWPQTVDTQTLVALASQKQNMVCLCRVTCAFFFKGGGRHSGLQLHGPGPMEPGFPKVQPVPCKGPHLQSWRGNICLCQAVGYQGPGDTCVAITPHLDWGFSLHMAFLQESSNGSCPKLCFQASTEAGLPVEMVGMMLPLPPSQTESGTVYRPKILCLPVGIREGEKVIQELETWLCRQNRPFQRHKAEWCDHLYQLYMTIYH